jgi:hypothetical protein
MYEAVREGIRLFNTRRYFEAHEALEAVWLESQGDEKIFLHALIQIAAAFHHYERRNLSGCASLLKKGLHKLERSGAEENGIDVEGLRRQVLAWLEYLAEGSRTHPARTPPTPKIRTIQGG